jgi:hypothetical protein
MGRWHPGEGSHAFMRGITSRIDFLGPTTIMNKFVVIIMAILFFNSFAMAQERCSDFLSPYIQETNTDRLLKITELHARGKQAIPLLLPEIENTEVAPIQLENPFLSYKPFISPTLCGAVAAYLIEMILGKPFLSIHEFQDKTSFMIEGNPESYVYGLGYIIDLGSGKPIGKGKLRKIAGLYRRWWEANAGKSLESMRDDWRRGKRPLTGSAYEWK